MGHTNRQQNGDSHPLSTNGRRLPIRDVFPQQGCSAERLCSPPQLGEVVILTDEPVWCTAGFLVHGS